jgi:hypothetical protein
MASRKASERFANVKKSVTSKGNYFCLIKQFRRRFGTQMRYFRIPAMRSKFKIIVNREIPFVFSISKNLKVFNLNKQGVRLWTVPLGPRQG